MNKKKLLLLINKDIDKELNPDEKLLLENEIRINPESGKMYKELKQVLQLIEKDADYSHEEVDVADEVLNKINKDKYSTAGKRLNIWSILKFSPKKRIILSYSLGVLTGIVLLAIAYSSGIINRIDPGLSGTIADIETQANFEKGGEIFINLDKINGTVKSQFSDNLVIFSLNFNSTEKFRIDFHFDEANLKLYSIKPLRSNNLSNFTSAENSVLFNNQGDNKYMILFRSNTRRNAGENIIIKLTSESGQLNEYSLSVKN